jgi:putative DNA primase/helicase
MTQPIDILLARLDRPRKSGKGYTCRCPAHEDRGPSLSVTEASDGRVLLHCFAGCDTIDVLQAIGLDWKDLFPGGMDTNAKREYRKQASAQAKKDAEFILLFAENAPFLSESDEQYFAGIRKNLDDAERVLAEAERTESVVSPRLQADIHTPLPFSTDKGKPLKHIANLAEICARLGVTIRYNVIKKEEEILIPGEGFSIDNQANASFAWLMSECSLFDFATDKLGDFLTYLSDKNLYNPVAEWIDSRPWDGVPRLQSLFDTVTSSGCQSLKETLMNRWMVSACAAAYNHTGVSAHGVLTFQGDQYLGKTKWFKQLIPAELGLLKDGMLLRPDDKDSVKQVCSFWLVELGELDATFRKSDIAALKSFITNDSDVLRRAYARKESHFARRTVFFASVNPREFLHDPTGNRRFWTVPVTKLDHSHSLDMQQVWAEVATLYRAGESIYLTPSEMDELNCQNGEFTVIDPVEEMILSRLAWESDQGTWRWATTTDVLKEVGMDRPTKADLARASTVIRANNGGQSKRSNGKNLVFCPPMPMRY